MNKGFEGTLAAVHCRGGSINLEDQHKGGVTETTNGRLSLTLISPKVKNVPLLCPSSLLAPPRPSIAVPPRRTSLRIQIMEFQIIVV